MWFLMQWLNKHEHSHRLVLNLLCLIKASLIADDHVKSNSDKVKYMIG